MDLAIVLLFLVILVVGLYVIFRKLSENLGMSSFMSVIFSLLLALFGVFLFIFFVAAMMNGL